MNPSDAEFLTYAHYAACFRYPAVYGTRVAYVSLSPYAREVLAQFIHATFAPPIAEDILEQNHVIPLGIEDGFVPGNADPDRLIVPYSRWDEANKNITTHAKLTREYARRLAARDIYVSSDFFLHPAFPPGHFDDVYTFRNHLDRPQLKDIVPQYGMFLCTATMESFGLFYLELLAAGCVGAFLDAPWIRSLLPGYKFIASADRLVAMMIDIRENWSSARDYVISTVRADIYARYSERSFGDRVVELADELATGGPSSLSGAKDQ
jgi:hypothetical protein